MLCCTSRDFYRTRTSHKREYLLSSDVLDGRVIKVCGRGREENFVWCFEEVRDAFCCMSPVFCRAGCSEVGFRLMVFGGGDVVWGLMSALKSVKEMLDPGEVKAVCLPFLIMPNSGSNDCKAKETPSKPRVILNFPNSRLRRSQSVESGSITETAS